MISSHNLKIYWQIICTVTSIFCSIFLYSIFFIFVPPYCSFFLPLAGFKSTHHHSSASVCSWLNLLSLRGTSSAYRCLTGAFLLKNSTVPFIGLYVCVSVCFDRSCEFQCPSDCQVCFFDWLLADLGLRKPVTTILGDPVFRSS